MIARYQNGRVEPVEYGLTPVFQKAPKSKSARDRFRAAAFAFSIAAYFVFITWPGLRMPFAGDDMMNMAGHWRAGPWRLFYSNFLLWHDFYRPMGGLFYVPIFHFFGLNARAFHAALLPLLLLLVALVYRLARTLGAVPLEAWLAALVVSGHAGLSFLYFETKYIYDVFCAIFYVGALLCYARARSRGRLLGRGETALFLLLFLCALNSKEMAVTLPPMLLAYEWLYCRSGAESSPRAGAGLWRRLMIPGIAALMTAVFVYGRVLRGLGQQQGYLAEYSVGRVLAFQQRQFQSLFLQSDSTAWAPVVVVWLLFTYFAWRRGRPLLRFSWMWIVLTPLPLEFLEGRGGATLAVPLVGWAILGGAMAVALARLVAGDMQGAPGFRRFGPQTGLALVVVLMAGSWMAWNASLFRDTMRTYRTGVPDTEVIRQFQLLNPKVRPHSTVIFLNDPFQDWDMAFIAELWFHDRSVILHLQRKTPLTPAELARADYLFDWRDGKLVLAGGAATASPPPRP